MRTKQHLSTAEDAPYIEDNTVHCCGKPISVVHINTEDLIVIDYFVEGTTVDVYVFVNVNECPQEIHWHDLSDKQRFRIRMSIRQRDDYADTPFGQYNLGGYADNRYYTLEALVENR